MKTKPITPYQHLLDEIKAWAFKVTNRHTVAMWHYPKARLTDGWSVLDLYERTKAAEQLGYDVVLKSKDDGLHVQYVKRVPNRPFSWQ